MGPEAYSSGVVSRANAVRMIVLALLVIILTARAVEAATVNVLWDPNQEPDVIGYIVSWGTSSGIYTNSANVGNQTIFLFSPSNTAVAYYIVVQAYNSGGLTSAFSKEVVVPPSATVLRVPSAITGTASAIGLTMATLNGSASPNGSATTAYFQYGLTTGYGGLTPTVSIGSGTSSVVVSGGVLSGLTCGTLYHYRLLATNAAGPAAGADATFSTTGCITVSRAPRVTTGIASSVGATTATLTATVNPNGWSTSAYFQYGKTTAYGMQTTGIGLGDATIGKAVASMVFGLSCGTVYHFRAVATNSQGTSSGGDATLLTAACVAR
jgi:hypothetical protein